MVSAAHTPASGLSPPSGAGHRAWRSGKCCRRAAVRDKSHGVRDPWGAGGSSLLVSSSLSCEPVVPGLPEILEATQATFKYVSFLLNLAVGFTDKQVKHFQTRD